MKTEQERIDFLANKVRDFNIVVSGSENLSGGFGELPPVGQGDITIEDLEKAFHNFNIVGGPGILVAGDLYRGYAIHVQQGPEGATGFPPVVPVPPTPPPPETGACCGFGLGCVEVSEIECLEAGQSFIGGRCIDVLGCCILPMSFECVNMTNNDCDGLGGTFASSCGFCCNSDSGSSCCSHFQICCTGDNGQGCCDDDQVCCDGECCSPGFVCCDGGGFFFCAESC